MLKARLPFLVCCCVLVGLPCARAQAPKFPEDAVAKLCPDDDACKNGMRFLNTFNQQMSEANATKDKALHQEYVNSCLAYGLAGCDELAGSKIGSLPSLLDVCAAIRAKVSEMPDLAKINVEGRALQIRSSALH